MMCSVQRRSCLLLSTTRRYSAWIAAKKQSKAGGSQAQQQQQRPEPTDVGRLFSDERVQGLLHKLTGVSVDKTFANKRISQAERPHYALMSVQEIERTREAMTKDALERLQMVPFVEPRDSRPEILSDDKEIAGFDKNKFVFTDITFDVTNRERTVVVREPDGVLRTATPEERDRMNRVYFERPYSPPFPPGVFSDSALTEALNSDKHEFVLDWACWYYEPDNPEFVNVARTVYDHADKFKKYDLLWATRHYGGLVFYLVLNHRIDGVLEHYAEQKKASEAADLIRLYRTAFTDWRKAIKTGDSDVQIIQDYVEQYCSPQSKLSSFLQGIAPELALGSQRSPQGPRKTPPSSRKPRPPNKGDGNKK